MTIFTCILHQQYTFTSYHVSLIIVKHQELLPSLVILSHTTTINQSRFLKWPK